MEDISILRPYDVCGILEGISLRDERKRIKREIRPDWRHYKLKEYLSQSTAASVTLTFQQIEELDGRPLPLSARKNRDWWYPRSNCNTIAEAWRTEGYVLQNLDLDKEKVHLRRDEDGVSKLDIPAVLLRGKLPDNAVFELETHMAYIIEKYGLDKKVK